MNILLSIPPSVNHAYANVNIKGHRNRRLTPLAESWKLEAGYLAKAVVRQEGWTMPGPDEKVILEVVAYWPDKRRRDMNNLHKLLCDALEGIVYPDDKMVLVRDMDFFVDRKAPRVECKVYLKGEP